MNAFFRRWAVGLGGAFENSLQNAPAVLALPILSIGMGISPITIGIALAIPRLWEIVLDPWIGVLTDKTNSRWGRRKPFLVCGAVFACVLFSILWWIPNEWSDRAKEIWIVGMFLLIYTAFSFYAVAYSALAIEYSSGNERVRLMAARTGCSNASAVVISWLYWACQLPIFENPVVGAKYVCLGFSVILLVAALMPAFGASSIYAAPGNVIRPESKSSHGEFFRLLRIAPLRWLLLGLFLFVSGFTLVAQLGFYIILFHMFHGDNQQTGVLAGVMGTVSAFFAILCAPLVAYISNRAGKIPTFCIFLSIGILGCCSTWWTMNASSPYLALLSVVGQALSLAAFWTIMPALLGDVSDMLEEKYSLAVQGALSAIYGIVVKSAISLSLLCTGLLLAVCGFDSLMKLDEMGDALSRMRLFYAIAPSVGMGLSMICISMFKSDLPSGRSILERLTIIK